MTSNPIFEFAPIATYHSLHRYPQEVPRQTSVSNLCGKIVFKSSSLIQQALKDLDGFDHIWVVFVFHEIGQFKAMIKPPGLKTKKGVFATRSPHRPNPIGMSTLKLISINDLTLRVSNSDLIDKTPILDIKPYINHCDQIRSERQGWLNLQTEERYSLKYTSLFEKQATWLLEHLKIEIKAFCETQLTFDPFNNRRKRVKKINTGFFEVAFRTWRLNFRLIGKETLELLSIKSGYTQKQIIDFDDDPYLDKRQHVQFHQSFK